MAESAFEKLVAHARSEHVVVVGGGISGLVAALDCAKIGMRVTVLEASDRLGGAVAAAEVAGCEVALGATGWSTRGGAVDELVDELGEQDAERTLFHIGVIHGLRDADRVGNAMRNVRTEPALPNLILM